MYAVTFAGAFAVGISLDGVHPVIGPGIIPGVDETDVTDTLEILVVEGEYIAGLDPSRPPLKGRRSSSFVINFWSSGPAGRPGSASGGDAYFEECPLDEAGAVGVAFAQSADGEVFLWAWAVVVFTDLQGADFGEVDGGDALAECGIGGLLNWGPVNLWVDRWIRLGFDFSLDIRDSRPSFARDDTIVTLIPRLRSG